MILNALVEKLKRRSKDDFKGRHFEATLILQAVSWYLRYPLSYRDIEELFLERGLEVDHSTLNRLGARLRSPDRTPAAALPQTPLRVNPGRRDIHRHGRQAKCSATAWRSLPRSARSRLMPLTNPCWGDHARDLHETGWPASNQGQLDPNQSDAAGC